MEINDGYLNQRNYSVVNEFLTSLRNANNKAMTIKRHRTRLQYFFKDRKEEFTTITQNDIQKWLEKLQGDWNERKLQGYVATLRAFYEFCKQIEYVKQSPVMEKKKVIPGGTYWILKKSLSNEINQTVVNEYLEDMKDSGRNVYNVKTHRIILQQFFIACKKPYNLITEEDIKQWIDKHRGKWTTNSKKTITSIIRSLFSFCEEKNYIESMPIKKNAW